MNYRPIINELTRNKDVFRGLLFGLTEKEYLWKPLPEKWNALEIICHLYDEEREDFRARTRHVLENQKEPLPSIDPQGWVEERKYNQQDYSETLDKFLSERQKSIKWLKSLQSPQWDNAYDHPKFGSMTAKMFLSNWLAHDYIHIRQLLRLKFEYLKIQTGEGLNYAGNW